MHNDIISEIINSELTPIEKAFFTMYHGNIFERIMFLLNIKRYAV